MLPGRERAPFAWFGDDDGGARRLAGLVGRRHLVAGESFEAWCADLTTWQREGLWVALALNYALGHTLESAAGPGEDPPGGHLARAWAFHRAERLSAAAAAAELARVADAPAGVVGATPTCSAAEYADGVAAIRAGIAAGSYYQVNLCFGVDFEWFGSPHALFARLAQRQPSPYIAFLEAEDDVVLSLSPELFVSRHGDRLRARPMKGTALRGADPLADRRAAEALARSAKDRAENVMIVDLLRNDLGRLAVPGSVRVDRLCELEALPTVWQMTSTISARARVAGLAEILRALFPCGSITGAPKIAAMREIARLERAPRGLYTGAVGWLAPDGDLRLSVAIRTPELAIGTDRPRGRMGVGAGITIDSDPAAEYAECLAKARFLIHGDPGLELVETLRVEPGDPPTIGRLDAHLSRLAASANAFGFPCDVAASRRALLCAAADATGSAPWRLRLTLGHDGAIAVTVTPLEPLPPRLRVRVATARLDPSDPLRRHKTSARSLYERALAAVRGEPEVFDVVFLNQRGELCEGARSNVFLSIGGRFLTPPLASGCLPGVLRAELLASGEAVEQVIAGDQLRRAEQVWVGNALRGLLPVSVDSELLAVA